MLTYRLHELKHLPLLDLLHLEDILQGDFVEMLPNQVHLAVCLQAPGRLKRKYEVTTDQEHLASRPEDIWV